MKQNSEKVAKQARIGLVGCGTVGRGVVELLHEKRAYLKEKYGFVFEVCLISDYVRGTLVSQSGLDLAKVVASLAAGGNLHAVDGVRKEPSPLDGLLGEAQPDLLCDCTPTNYETGQPSLGILEIALKHGINAVTCSKGGIGKDLVGLRRLAAGKGVSLRYESSVLSGTPLISLVRGPLAGCELLGVEGIVNGTTNFILTKMAEGMGYAEALAEAQRLGYAETDPTGDVEGFDAAVKVAIMAAEFFDTPIKVSEVRRTGISGVTAEDVKKAAAGGRRIKLVAGIEKKDGKVGGFVEPRALDTDHPLAGVHGATNAVCLRTDNLGEVTIIGPGAGAIETAQGILSDILDIAGVTCR